MILLRYLLLRAELTALRLCDALVTTCAKGLEHWSASFWRRTQRVAMRAGR